MRRKVTVIGAGAVGATAAQEIARRDYADVVLVDIIENLPQGKALDINQAGPILGYEPTVVGTNGYDETAGSEVVVITSGKPRTPGMSRDDLVTTNQGIVKSVTEPGRRALAGRHPHRRHQSPGRHVPRGQGRFGISEGARLRPRPESSTARASAPSSPGRPGLVRQGRERNGARRPRRPDGLGRLRDDGRRRPDPGSSSRKQRLAESLVQRTAVGGGEVVQLLGTSAWYAPGAACAQMVDAVPPRPEANPPVHRVSRRRVRNRTGMYMGVPVKLGAGGIEEIIELELDRRGAAGVPRFGRGGAGGSWTSLIETIPNKYAGSDYQVDSPIRSSPRSAR